VYRILKMRAAILTISDSVSRGIRKDASGPTLRDRCAQLGWEVVSEAVLPDEPAAIRDRLAAHRDDLESAHETFHLPRGLLGFKAL
jgi:molybdopterin biosynthesis enzyme MoaB